MTLLLPLRTAVSVLPWPRLLRGGLLAMLALLLSACAYLPRSVERPPAMALHASSATTLGRIAAVSQPEPGLSGFRLLPGAPFALDTRLQLIRRAEQSVDVQYYHIADDEVGHLLLRELRDAGLRGVRVRLLVDDLYTENLDPTLLGLAAHPNVEVRLFNPFPGGRDFFLTRFLRSAHEFGRVNRRMHNKLLIADGAMAVTGGRNIANEYYLRHEQANFVDLDTFATGPIVTELATYFDDYWNSPVVFPVAAIARTELSRPALQQQFEAITADIPAQAPPPDYDALGYGPIAEDLDAGRLGLVWAQAWAYADAPERIKGMGASYGLVPLVDVESVRYNVIELMRRARSEVIMTTPYLIPGDKGMELFAELRARKIKLRVLTNSLAATDEPLVHIGYERYREPMLRLGVELHELSPGRAQRSKRLMVFRNAHSRLHAKTAVIDKRLVFLGSMNFDPRSEKHNTEMGVFIDSPPLAREILRLMDLDKLQASYQVMLRTGGQGLQWVANDDDGEVVLTEEPEADRLTLLLLKLLAPLAPEELL